MAANPPEHPFESAPIIDDPQSPEQSAIDVHLEALDAQFTRLGHEVESIVISVRCKEAVDAAGNDVANGFRVSGEEIGTSILAHVSRLLRSARRAFAPELR